MSRTEPKVNTKRLLSWRLNDGKCCLCKNQIGYYEEPGFIGEFAHILDLQQATSRYIPEKSVEELNSKENLILLCPNCHTKIDKFSEEFPAIILTEKKYAHENNVKKNIDFANSEYFDKFYEIVDNLRNLVKDTNYIKFDYNIIEVSEKISKNDLDGYQQEINESLEKVGYYITYLDTFDHKGKEEIRKMVMAVYWQYLETGKRGIDLFESIWLEVSSRKPLLTSYSLIIICYYFEECDVFEK